VTCKLAFAFLTVSAAIPAHAATDEVSGTIEYTDFTEGFGNREVGTVEYSKDLGETAIILSGSYGRREFSSETFEAGRASATLYHDWSDRFYTRTSVAAATNDPVFATREVIQDLNFKIQPQTVLLAGAKYTRYFGHVDAFSWTLGGTQYFKGGFVSYRYTGYDVENVGNTHGHLASLRVNDAKGAGNTQLWLGTGTSLHEQEFLPVISKGDVHSIALKRVQPINSNFALELGLGHSWYDTGLAEYQGTAVRLGLSFSR
jgi:YaiO family outer membrane protein